MPPLRPRTRTPVLHPPVRLSAAVSGLVLLTACAATPAPATAAPDPDRTAVQATDDRPRYVFRRRVRVPSTANQQGLARAGDHHVVAFDMGGGRGRLIAYDGRGTEVKRSPLLPLAHAPEVSHRAADGNFYVTVTEGGGGLRVAVVDMRPATPRLVRTYDFSHLGSLGMVAVDDVRDQMVVKSGPRRGPHTFTTTDMSGRVLAQFTDVSQGLGQGLEVVGDDILLYTSAPRHASNTITVYGRDGVVRSRIPVPVAVEGQGLSVDRLTGELYVGFADHTIAQMSPRYVPSAPVPPANLLVNAGAEGSADGTGNAAAVALPSWSTTGGMTAIRYGLRRYPSAASPGPRARGSSFFSGGTKATATMTQVVPVTALAPVVDAGTARFELSGWLGGYAWQADRAEVVATFRDAGGSPLRSARIGPVTPHDRAGVTGMLRRSAVGAVPAGTRSVRVVVTATRAEGAHDDAYADALRLTIR